MKRQPISMWLCVTAILVSLFASAALALPAVTVAMRDGKQYIGDIVGKGDASLTLRTNTATMTIAWRNVTIETFKALHPDLYVRLKAKAEERVKKQPEPDGLAIVDAKAQQVAAEHLGIPVEKTLLRSRIVLCLIPAGTFMMGSPTNEEGRGDGEVQHEVTISKPFYIGKYEVTQGQWKKMMRNNPSQFKEVGKDGPVEKVSWNDCQEFIRKLEELEGLPKGSMRLPTEAEWEYACRAGTQTTFCYGNDLDSSMANFNGDFPYGKGRKGKHRERTMPVGSFTPNAWGLYDMHGNVWEWCQDWWGGYGGDATDPSGPGSGPLLVIRGGCWDSVAPDCRSAFRRYYGPADAYNCYYGFRLVVLAGQLRGAASK